MFFLSQKHCSVVTSTCCLSGQLVFRTPMWKLATVCNYSFRWLDTSRLHGHLYSYGRTHMQIFIPTQNFKIKSLSQSSSFVCKSDFLWQRQNKGLGSGSVLKGTCCCWRRPKCYSCIYIQPQTTVYNSSFMGTELWFSVRTAQSLNHPGYMSGSCRESDTPLLIS